MEQTKPLHLRRMRLEIILAIVVWLLVLTAVLFGGNLLAMAWTGANLETGTAAISAVVLRFIGAPIARDGTFLTLGSRSFEVVTECTGITVLVLVGAFILAFPAAWPQKLKGFLGAAALVYGLNIARIVVLVLVAAGDQSTFTLLHEIGWPAFIVLTACGYFYAWAVSGPTRLQTQ